MIVEFKGELIALHSCKEVFYEIALYEQFWLGGVFSICSDVL